MEKKLLFGNEAIALGAYLAGVKVGVGYPGTPSTEILETFSKFDDIYSEWSINEKVALEVGIGSSLAGARTLVTMKHVGVNVASDPLFTASYIGVKGGLIIVTADDPNMHSSQNEQDNRHYARSAKIPMLEPSDSQEAFDFMKIGLELSEKYDTPVFLRSTTRLSHSKSIVNFKNEKQNINIDGFSKNPKKYVMIPAYARLRHVDVEKRLNLLKEESNNISINKIEYNNKKIGFITSGVCYNYVKEAYPDASILKLGLIYPLPEKLISDFINNVERAIIVEELDPFFEEQIKALGHRVEGKKYFSLFGELSSSIIKNSLENKIIENKYKININIPPRPPQLCPGCPHRPIFSILSKKNVIICGDIGCYTLGVMPPFNAMDTCVDMGASISLAHGINAISDKTKVISVIGDSTFAHSGITGLINAAYNKRNFLVIVLDNGTTAMTGMQPNPLSGKTIKNEETITLDYQKLAESIGIIGENFKIVDAYKPEIIEETIEQMLNSNKLSLLVIKGLCVILKRKTKEN